MLIHLTTNNGENPQALGLFILEAGLIKHYNVDIKANKDG